MDAAPFVTAANRRSARRGTRRVVKSCTRSKLTVPGVYRRFDRLNAPADRLDRTLSAFMARHGHTALRLALAVIFIWFGLLKPFGLSPAQRLVEDTVYWMPFFSPRQYVTIIGWWEVVIGLLFLVPRPWATRGAIGLLALQMAGTFMPLVLLPTVTFQPGRWPWAPTTEGQYILKNLLILAAAITLGGTVRGGAGAVKEDARRSPL